jgi:hypothetical protein
MENGKATSLATPLTVTLEGAVIAALRAYAAKYDTQHSIQYVLEDCLTAGVDAKMRSKKYSEETRNRKDFEKAIAADPTVVLDAARMMKLCVKYGIGGTAIQAVTKVADTDTEELEATA